ncbi:DUF4832 domain-containing protein [Lacunimicrobium album]
MRHSSLIAIASAVLLLLVETVNLHAEDLVVKPAPAPGPIDNPLKGWCPYVNAGEIRQPYSMVYLYVPWSELEPTSGEYRFDEWEKSWNVDEAQGKHIIFRVYIDYPSLPSGLPDWLRKEGVKETPYKDHGGGRSPDYNDPKMLDAMERLIEALGKRYNHHPRIAFIQLGLLGFWGEWHTWPREEMYATAETERRIIDAYHTAFPDKSLMVRYARDHAGQQAWIGFHDDMFPEDTDNGEDWGFLSGLRSTGRVNNWKTSVVGGEMVPGKARQWLGKDYDTTLTMLERAHFTWIGPYCPALERSGNDQFLERSQALVRKMGYEFQLTELRHPSSSTANDSIEISLKGQNTGVAPFYYPWSVEFALLDETGKVVTTHKTNWDVRNWQPGEFNESATLTFNVKPGTYQLAFGIRDPWPNRPAIKFANQLTVIEGWSILSNIEITQ